MRKEKKPITYIGAFEGKNYTQFLGGKINRHSAKNGLRISHSIRFSKKFLGETPNPPPPRIARELKKKKLPSLALYDPLPAKVKILPYHVYRRSEL